MNDMAMKTVVTAEPGEIVAAVFPDGKVKSGKIVKKYPDKKIFIIGTSYGKEVPVSYNDVMWVKRGRLWPARVMREFRKNSQMVNGNEKNR